jgi:hypothetical protein
VSGEPDGDLELETGGPTWRLWMRTGFAPAEPAPLGRRALVLAAICWLPLFVLSLRDGLATGDSVPVPFVRDFAAYARFIGAVVLLTLADAAVAQRLRGALRHMYTARLLTPKSEPQLAAILATARRRVDSNVVELVLLALAYWGSWSAIQRQLSNGMSTWHALAGPDGETLTLAGWWSVLVSVPIFEFLFLRWLFRGVLWAQLLAQISRLELRLVATHPDRAAGLGFLSIAQSGFAILVLAASMSLSAVLADEVVYRGVALESLYPVMIGFAVAATLLVLAPLLAFAPRLARLKREALHAFGALSSRHDTAFAEKWIGVSAQAESLLGDADASSLADLVTGYERAKALRPIPIDLAAMAPLVVAAAIPMIPLIATKVPLKDVLAGLVKVIM